MPRKSKEEIALIYKQMRICFKGNSRKSPFFHNAPFIYDFSQVLSADQLNQIESFLMGYEDSTSTQIAVLIESDLNGYDVFDRAMFVAREWKIGQKDKAAKGKTRRSKKAAEKLSELGFTKIYELQGGIMKWNAAGLSVPSDKIIGMCSQEYNELLNTDKIVLIDFYAEWCAPCKKELNTIHELYEDWQAETGVTLVAVSIDDEKTKSQVPVYVNGKAWDYLILMDPNGDFKRAMGVNNVPHTFLVDKDGNIVYSHNNYAPGDEEKLFQEIKKLTGK